MAVSERGRSPASTVRGDTAIAASAGALEDADIAEGDGWSVAVCGDVDSVGSHNRPVNPAYEIAAAFDRSGIKAASEVHGDFTCIATDGRRLIAFRDHLGTDGLFVGHTAQLTCVMSEPKQVLAATGGRRSPDIDALVSVFFSQWEAEDDVPCVVEGVDRVPRGQVVEATVGGWHALRRLWDPSDLVETASISVEEATARTWELVCAAVERAICGPTAVSLSGGIDSTLIAAALAEVRGTETIGAISAIYPESPSVDESRYIEDTARSIGIDSETYAPTSARMANLTSWVDRFDGPTYGLAIGALDDMNRFARAHGYRTVLSGEMAELAYDLREHAIGRMIQRGALGPAMRNLIQLKSRGVPSASLLRMVGASLTPSPLALAYARRKPVETPAPWLDPSFMPGLGSRWDLERRPSRRWSEIQAFFATGPSYPGLEISTIMGDYSAVKTRRPLVDRPLWEFLLTLPPEVKFPDAWTKSLIRRVLNGRAPDSVVWRSDKTVFDEDSRRNADYETLTQRIDDGFQLPGVRYAELTRALRSGELSSFELSMARSLASIHAFIEIAS